MSTTLELSLNQVRPQKDLNSLIVTNFSKENNLSITFQLSLSNVIFSDLEKSQNVNYPYYCDILEGQCAN